MGKKLKIREPDARKETRRFFAVPKHRGPLFLPTPPFSHNLPLLPHYSELAAILLLPSLQLQSLNIHLA